MYKTEKYPKRNHPVLIWDKKVPNTELEKFCKMISLKYHLKFDTYWDLQRWSVQHFTRFWEEVWNYVGIITSMPYETVYRKTGPGFLDCEWFPGCHFNFAENVLRYRDDSKAMIYLAEDGTEETVTYAELFEEVKLYASAFRKNGLKKNDVVGCYMSNRKEAFFAFLAAASIGAIFGGPQPYFGAAAISHILKTMSPRFLITVDELVESGKIYRPIDHLPFIIKNTPSLEKVIIVSPKQSTLSKDLSGIPNSCLLPDFLQTGYTTNGDIPGIEFEQLPFEQPLCINFTSGTTGLPKGHVHSAGTLISQLVSIVFYWNLSKGDVVYTCYPVGWALWDSFVPCLLRGLTLLLYDGAPCLETVNGSIWDIFAKYKVSYAYLVTSMVDKLAKNNVIPGSAFSLEKFKILSIGGSPVNPQNYFYIRNRVKENVFICNQYGATECFGKFSAFDFNLPSYAGEIQLASLGMDIRCFDEQGYHMLDTRGEMVIATPNPSLPLYIWQDKDNKLMYETYLAKYPGFWCQNDEICINSTTKGFIVIGRSDAVLIQNGDRFGSFDIYSAIYDVEEVEDSICVNQSRKSDHECRAVLFVKTRNDHPLTPELKAKIKKKIAEELWEDCVPKLIVQIPDIPYTANNKKVENIVQKIVASNSVPEMGNIRNPDCLKSYLNIPEILNYNKI